MTYLSKQLANEREHMVFGRDYDPNLYSMGGICRFDSISAQTAQALIDAGLMDPDDAQNCSPTNQEMVDFCTEMGEGWYLHGYVVSPMRDDVRVSIEGVGCTKPLEAEQALEFIKMFRDADELSVEIGEPAYCWYD